MVLWLLRPICISLLAVTFAPVSLRAQMPPLDESRVPVVENRTPAWSPAQRWRLSATPTLEIGTDIGDPNNYTAAFDSGHKLRRSPVPIQSTRFALRCP